MNMIRIPAMAAFAVASMVLAAAPAGAQVFGTNLVVNGGAESGPGGSGAASDPVPGFTTTTGGLAVISYATGGGYPTAGDLGVTAANGANFFGGGFSAVTISGQRIDLSSGAATIDLGGTSYSLSALLGGFDGQEDNARFALSFLDSTGLVTLGSDTIGPVSSTDRGGLTGFVARSSTGAVPIGSRFADVALTLTRAAGSANDGYADNLSLVLTSRNVQGVPEPATWGLMIAGFGLTGAALRRRRGRPALA